MIEVFATLKVFDKKSGAYLGKAECITDCDCCGDMDEFTDKHGREIAYYLHNHLTCKLNANGALFALRLIELEDEDNEDENELDEEEVINTFRRWF